MTQNKKYLLRKIGKRVCHVAMTISSVAVVASTTVHADEVNTSNGNNVTITTEAKDDSNAKLLETIEKAKENHVVVELTKDVNYKTANEANADIDSQIKTIDGLIELVSNANERLSKVVDEATKAGVKLDKEIKLTYVDYEELAEVTLGSNLKFRDEKINPKRVKVGQYYEFIITPPKGKTISKVELNKQDLVSLVKDNIFACKITQNCKFELSFAEYKDTQKFKLTVDSRVELLEGLKAGEHPIGTKITFKVKHEENKYLEKVKFGSFEAEIKDKDFVYTCFLNGDLSITTSLQSHPTVTIDSANKDNLELLDGVEDTKQVKPNTTIRFKLKNLTEGYSYQVYIKDKQVKPEADGSYKYEVEKKSIIISVKKAKIAHQLTFNYNSFLFEDTKISYDNKVEHGEMVKFKFPKETNLENVKHVKLRWVENGEWKEKELTSEGGIYSFKMDQPYTIKVEFK